MKWFEYKQEVDALRAPDELKARLLAMQSTAQTDAAKAAPAYKAPAAPEKPHKAPLRFSAKRILPVAASFALGVVCCGAVLGSSLGLLRMGSTASDNGAYFAEDSAQSTAAYTINGAEAGTSYGTAGSADAVGSVDTANKSTADGAGGTASVTLGTDDTAQAEAQTDASQRMIIYNSSLSIESKAYDDTLTQLTDAVAAAGGYISGRDEYSYADSSRNVTLTCRIPAAQYKSFLAAAETSGSVVQRSETASDVTADYIDVSARVDALTAQRDRLLTLEAQADTLENLLTIEDQLTNVQYELESYQSQLNWYKDQVSYCTVTIDVSEVQTYTPTETGFLARLGRAFGDALTGFGTALGSILLWLVLRWPWLVLIAAAAAAVWLIRRHKRRV